MPSDNLWVVMLKGVNVRGHNPVSSSELLSHLRKNDERTKWVCSVGSSGNFLFADSSESEESDIKAHVAAQLRANGITQPFAIRRLGELRDEIHIIDKALQKLGKKVNSHNSTVEKTADGEWKAGTAFLIDDNPLIVKPKYPTFLLRDDVQLIGSTRRNFQFLWKRTNGTVGVPNGAIERHFEVNSTSRLYSIILRIVNCHLLMD